MKHDREERKQLIETNNGQKADNFAAKGLTISMLLHNLNLSASLDTRKPQSRNFIASSNNFITTGEDKDPHGINFQPPTSMSTSIQYEHKRTEGNGGEQGQ